MRGLPYYEMIDSRQFYQLVVVFDCAKCGSRITKATARLEMPVQHFGENFEGFEQLDMRDRNLLIQQTYLYQEVSRLQSQLKQASETLDVFLKGSQ